MPATLAQHELACPECGAPMVLRPGRFGQFYGCTRFAETGCKGRHGAHPDGAPMGTPATADVKRARIEAHRLFDRLWQSKKMKRTAAYAWLSQAMGLPSEQAHIGRFDREQCARVIALVEEKLASYQERSSRPRTARSR